MNGAIHHDRYGLPLSTTSGEAAQAYGHGVDLMLSAWPGAAQALERAIALDPDFALAHIARARIHAFYQQGAAPKAKAAIAREKVAQRGSQRERSHVDALALAVEGRIDAALQAVLSHLKEWPCDALVMSLPLGAFGLLAFSGMADHDRARRDLCERYARHYGEDWWFLSNYGWAMTENGRVTEGRAMTERAFAMRRQNAYAAHALLHAMFEAGSVLEADALVRQFTPSYDRSGILFGHILWHQALCALEQDDAATALALYHNALQPGVSEAPPLTAASDCASLLWRLAAYGHDVPANLWVDAAGYAKRQFPNSSLPFVDVHMALLAAASGGEPALEQRLRAIEQRLPDNKLAAGPVVPQICRALNAFAGGDYRSCVAMLEPALADVVRIGGSHAQREIIEDTFIVALIRSGETAKARSLLERRLHRRPSPRDERWRAAAIAQG